MVAEKTLIKLGFNKDENNNSKFREIFKDNIKLKEIHIDVYPTNPLISSSTPFILLLRTIEKKMLVKNSGNRLVLKKNIDGFDTHFMNIVLSEIKECYYKSCDGLSEFILNIQNIYYRITVYN
jgi:hypothetical protein